MLWLSIQVNRQFFCLDYVAVHRKNLVDYLIDFLIPLGQVVIHLPHVSPNNCLQTVYLRYVAC